MSASAPGKLLLVGEYAVLDGTPAVVVAVDRRVVAHIADTAQPLSVFLQAARDQLAGALGPDHLATRAAANVIVDSASLRNADGTKLGLGSSAAATTAAIAAAIDHSGEHLDREKLHRLAFRAHAAAQGPRGTRGSGADIAASVFGGAAVVSRQGIADDEPIGVRPIELPAALILVSVWSGAAADTPSLVAKVRELRCHNADAYNNAIARIGQAATLLIAACETNDAATAVTAVAAGDDALAHLGATAGVALIAQSHLDIVGHALRCGGAAKPTGAGAGDISIAAFTSPSDAERFRAEIRRIGMNLPELSVDPRGAEIEPVATTV